MIRFSLSAIVVCFVSATGARAQPPHLEFARGLRKSGHADLALEYLESLAKQRIPTELFRVLPAEIAYARADVAARELDFARRSVGYRTAREELRRFVAGNEASLQTAHARLQSARIGQALGKAQIAAARPIQAVAARRSALTQAQTTLNEASTEFWAVLTAIDALGNDKTFAAGDRKELALLRQQAELEQAITGVHWHSAFEDVWAPARTELGKRTVAALKRIAYREPIESAAWLARAWLGRFHLEAQDYRAAKNEVRAVMESKDPAAADAKRIARYTQILLCDNDPEVKDPGNRKLRDAEQWLTDYKSLADTEDGLTIRFQLAEAQLEQSKKRTKAESARLITEAEKSFGIVERSASGLANTARERKLTAIYLRWAERTKGDISQLKDFQECWLRAQIEIYQRNQRDDLLAKKSPVDSDKNSDVPKPNQLVQALERALALADAATPIEDRAEAQYALAYLRLAELGDPYGAALLGEDLANRWPQAPKAAAAAGCAVEAYAKLLVDAGKTGVTHSADRERLRRLAERMESNWPADPATDHARFCIGHLALQGGELEKAIQSLSRIGPSYANFSMSRFLLAQAALAAHKARPDAETSAPLRQQALAALKDIPEIGPGTDSTTAAVYFRSRFELARMLFADKDYEELAKVSEQLTKAFGTMKPGLPDALVAETEPLVRALPAYAQCGRADQLFREGKHGAVLKLLAPLLGEFDQAAQAKERDPRLIRLIQSMALWSYARTGNAAAAEKLLEKLLQPPGDGALETVQTVVNDLLAQLRGQMDVLRSKGPEGADELRNTKERFAQFLDTAAGKPRLGETADGARFLALGYSILEEHSRAADFLAAIFKKSGAADKEGANRDLQVMHARELRLARRFDDARDTLRGLMHTESGKKDLELRKELLSLWEDKGEHAAAARGWSELMQAVRPSIDQNPRLKDLYFECYFRVVQSLCRAAEATSDGRKKAAELDKAASWYVKLKKNREDLGGGDFSKRYETLLDAMPEFKKACDEQARTNK